MQNVTVSAMLPAQLQSKKDPKCLRKIIVLFLVAAEMDHESGGEDNSEERNWKC